MIEGLLLTLIIYYCYSQQRSWIFILLLCFVYLIRYRKSYFKIILICVIAVVVLFSVGLLQNDEFLSFSFKSDKVKTITGVVREDSKVGYWGQKRCVIKLLECNLINGDVASAKGRISVSYVGHSLYYGDVVTFNGKLTDKGFNAREYKIITRSSLNRTRERFINFISSKVDNELSMMLLLGITPNVDSEVSLLARNSGNSHILALSGMHLSLLSALLVLLLTPIFNKRYAKIVALTFLSLYIIFIGPKPSLIRAYILSVVFLFIKVDKSIDGLVICFCLQLILFKDSVMTLSALLSYAALCGIMTIPKLLLDSLDSLIVIPAFIVNPFLVTISALLFTIPISFKVFGSYQISSILTSFIAGIIIYLYMIFCILALFSGKFYFVLEKIYSALIFVLNKGSLFKMQENLKAYYIIVFITLFIVITTRLKRLCK